MTTLALLRHGHTAWNRAGQIQGRSDIPLDDEARAQLATLTLPAPWSEARLVSSPLRRAAETAELVAHRKPELSSSLLEMNWGDWEGKRGADLIDTPDSGYRHIEDWGWSYCPPNGESPLQVWQRLEPWVASLSQDTIAVCHIGVMRVLLAKAHGWDFSGTAPFRIKRNRLYLIEIDEAGLKADPDPIRLKLLEAPK
ncbi:MAG: histidine phosphatase family protein [Rhodobacteraceae bacterium]|nr:histidine phosphatase family protein [Paracoccaceae bacterium]